MKTTNWQTKALTLFIAATALWLTTACDNAAPTIEVQPIPETTVTLDPDASPRPHPRCPYPTGRMHLRDTGDEKLAEHDGGRALVG